MTEFFRNEERSWRGGNIGSRAGRITLAKSIFSGIPVFFMQLQRLPAKIHKDIDRLVRRCVWGEMDSRNKMHLVSWETLCKPKHLEGGVGLRMAAWLSKALLAKLAWKVHT